MANTLAYYGMELITTVKSFTVEALDGLRMKIGQVEKKLRMAMMVNNDEN
jgi:hypothetical protein